MPSQKVLEQKQALVADLSKRLQNACTGVVVGYEGINVADDTALRKKMREAGVEYTVVKNTLLSRAAKDANLEGLDEVLEGTTAIATSVDSYSAAAKILCEFAKKNDFFKIKAGFVEGEVVGEAQVKALASLPSKEELIAKALGSMNAPITGLVTVLSGTIKSLAIALNAIAQQKESA